MREASVGLSSSLCFFFNDTATTEIYTLSLHDALPIFATPNASPVISRKTTTDPDKERRSEEHTSELQSRRDIVCRLLLEKKKHKQKPNTELMNRNSKQKHFRTNKRH